MFILLQEQLSETNWNVSDLVEMDMDDSICCFARTRQPMFIVD